MAKLKLGYTVIQHGPRIEYNLSMNQYSLASAIYHLSSNPENPVLGWCWASKKSLAAYFGFSDRTVYNLLNELIAAGWVERHPAHVDGENGLVRATARWYREIENWTGPKDPTGLPAAISSDPMQNVQTPPMQILHTPPAIIADNSNTNTNKVDTDVFSAQAKSKKNRGKSSGDEIPPFLEAQPTPAAAPPVAPAPPQSEPTQRSPEAQALLDDMAEYWNVSQTRFFHAYAQIARFLKEQEELGELGFVSAQFYAYKSARNVQPHNLDNWLGKPENGWLGAWNKEDYSKKLSKRQADNPHKPEAANKPSHLGARLNGANAAAARILAKLQQPQPADNE